VYPARLRISRASWGVLAFKQGYAHWSEGDRGDGKGLAHRALAAIQDRACKNLTAPTRLLGSSQARVSPRG